MPPEDTRRNLDIEPSETGERRERPRKTRKGVAAGMCTSMDFTPAIRNVRDPVIVTRASLSVMKQLDRLAAIASARLASSTPPGSPLAASRRYPSVKVRAIAWLGSRFRSRAFSRNGTHCAYDIGSSESSPDHRALCGPRSGLNCLRDAEWIWRKMSRPDAGYGCYADLAMAQAEGADFSVCVRRRPGSSVAILAPHGGAIEAGTSQVARAVAGSEFNLYLFEGIRASGNYTALHLTSHRFDEPRCLALLSACDHVVTTHGCRGDTPQVLLGGLDTQLKGTICQAIGAAGVETRQVGHRFRAVHPSNICNRGRRGAGVQIELTSALRLEGFNRAIVTAIRSVLLGL